MANRVVQIGRGAPKYPDYSSEVYRDISMQSKQVIKKDSVVGYQIDKLVNTRNVYSNNKRISGEQPDRTGNFKGAVQNSLKNIFTWIPGERIINPEFGSKLRKLLYEQITSATQDRIASEIKGSVSKWEPRVEILQIINMSSVEDTEDNIIRLDIKYRIKGLEDVYTYTYEQKNSK